MKTVFCCALLCSAAFAADAFPRLSGETLAGAAITLPDAAKGKQALFVITFSRSAQAQAKAWTDKLRDKKSGVATYQVLELEDVPRLFRGMVKGGIRKGIPQEMQPSFVLLFDGQDALKKLTEFNNDGNAYVLLLDGNGNVEWKESGAVSEQKLAALEKELSKK